MPSSKFTGTQSLDKIGATTKHNVTLDIDTDGRLVISSATHDGGLHISGANTVLTVDGDVAFDGETTIQAVPDPATDDSPISKSYYERGVGNILFIDVSDVTTAPYEYVLDEAEYKTSSLVLYGTPVNDIILVYPDTDTMPTQYVVNLTDISVGMKTVSNPVSVSLDAYSTKIVTHNGSDILDLSLTHNELNRRKIINFDTDADMNITSVEAAYQRLVFTDSPAVLTADRDVNIDVDVFSNAFLPFIMVENLTGWNISIKMQGGGAEVIVPATQYRLIYRDQDANEIYEIRSYLERLLDVNISGATDGDIIQYQVGNWTNVSRLGALYCFSDQATTTDATPTIAAQYSVALSAGMVGDISADLDCMQFSVMCAGVAEDGTSISVNVRGMMQQDTPSAAFIGTPTVETYDGSGAVYDITVGVSGTDSLDVTVTGDAAQDVHWVVNIEHMFIKAALTG